MSTDTMDWLDALKSADRARYAAVLYAPQEKREALAILHHFDLEIGRIRSLVSEPLPGEIRIQWWRDVITGDRRNEGRANPLGAALLDVIDQHTLPVSAFDMMLEGRITDLYDDPFPDRTAFEAWCGETRSTLFQLLVRIADETGTVNASDASGHGGCAWGVAQCLAGLAEDRLRGAVRIPEDILAATGGSAEAWLGGTDEAFAARAIEAFAALGREHLERALGAISELPQAARSVYLPLASCEPIFGKAEKKGAAIASEPLSVSPLRLQWAILRMAAKL